MSKAKGPKVVMIANKEHVKLGSVSVDHGNVLTAILWMTKDERREQLSHISQLLCVYRGVTEFPPYIKIADEYIPSRPVLLWRGSCYHVDFEITLRTQIGVVVVLLRDLLKTSKVRKFEVYARWDA